MFLIDNNDNLKIPNFLQALGFVPPAGLDVEEIYINDADAPSADKVLNNSGFEATQINPQYKTVRYQRKDPKTTFSFSDNYVVPETTATLAEFPKHIQASGNIPNGQPTPQYKIIKSPVKAVTILEGQNCYMLRIEEDNMILPKGSILKLTEDNENSLDNKSARDDLEEGSISKAYMFASLFANDLKMMHIHASGVEFDKIHSISEELYEEAQAEADELAEIALSHSEKVPNISDIKSYVDSETEWQPITDEVINWYTFTDYLNKKGNQYLDALNDISDEDPIIDDYIHFWQKEINYKNIARSLNEPQEADYYDILDDAEKEKNDELDAEAKELSDDTIDMFTYNDAYVNNSSWKGFEQMTDDMVVAQGEPVDSSDDEEDIDYSEEFNFDDIDDEGKDKNE